MSLVATSRLISSDNISLPTPKLGERAGFTIVSDAVPNYPQVLFAQRKWYAHVTKVLQYVVKKACVSEWVLPGL